MKIKGIIFDLDGTLIDADYDWKKVREMLDIKEGSILSNFEKLPPLEREKKEAILKEIEREHTERAYLVPGVRELLLFLKEHSIKTALVTNNTRDNVDYILSKFTLSFNVILTREDGFYKPDPKPMYEAIERLGLARDDVIAIGDSFLDLQSAKAAELPILIRKKNKDELPGADYYFEDGYDIIYYIREKIVL